MIRFNYFLVGLIGYLVAESNAGVASFIKPCKADDKACITASSQAALSTMVNGIPDLGVPTIDPMIIDSVRSDGNDLKLGFREITVTGVRKCKILGMERNTEKSTMTLVAECPLHGVGKYDLNGKIGPIVAYGDGDFEIHTKNVKFTVELRIKDIKKNGLKHWKITGFDYSYDLVEKVHIDLKNLFDGDEERAKPLKQILDTNSNELVQEIGKDLIRQLIAAYVGACEKLFLNVPAKELEISMPFITPCKPNDQKCILSSGKKALPFITAGVPALGLPVVDPIFIESARSDGANLKLGFRNMKITGVTKCKIIELGRNPGKQTMKMTVECPLTGVGQYDLKGKLSFIEAWGDGDFKIYTDKVKITVEIKTKVIEKNGKKHWKITGFDYSYEMLDKVYFDLKNLFGGDDKRAQPFREVLDHSWKEMIDEVGGPIIKQLIGKYVDVAKAFMLAVPVNELELQP
ncbi:uncharacterized protein LOC123870478 [Maniola jurtina]|uniref:uncharacterized protein LOC123870478 n=1 Tax=Maniola jurtina TaxID=191418 RepID=UPI001E688C00|nr:uncharacterized protein LOC123870478 [Maniola jurtina]